MVGSLIRLAAAAVFASALAGCADVPGIEFTSAPEHAEHTDAVTITGRMALQDPPQQCVPYARTHSGIDIHGDAYTWWAKAQGRYERGNVPKEGAVLVLDLYSGPQRGHVAVVRSIVSDREIHVDHANWFADGTIYVDDPVLDVSEDNDWSRVRVWNIRTGSWGIHDYPVQGFIGPGRVADTSHVAQNDQADDR